MVHAEANSQSIQSLMVHVQAKSQRTESLMVVHVEAKSQKIQSLMVPCNDVKLTSHHSLTDKWSSLSQCPCLLGKLQSKQSMWAVLFFFLKQWSCVCAGWSATSNTQYTGEKRWSYCWITIHRKEGEKDFVGVEKESLTEWKGWGINHIF